MTKKKCNGCREEKELGMFAMCAANKDGLQYKCKKCSLKWASENRHRFRARVAAYDAKRRVIHRVKIAAQQAAYRIKNMAKLNAYNSKYHSDNRDKILAHKKVWISENRHLVNEGRRDRYKSDPLYALARKLRSRTFEAFKSKRWRKRGGSGELLGCTWAEARAHIESKFMPGMSWGDGSFEIDHIIPLASAKTPEELAALCLYRNLQPLPMSENRRKSDGILFITELSTARQPNLRTAPRLRKA